MKNKNILMIAYYFPPAAGIGTFRITKFCKYLKKNGYNPIIVTVNHNYYSNIDETLLDDLNGIERYEIDLDKNKNSQGFYVSLTKRIHEIYDKTDIQFAFITGGPFDYMKIGPFLSQKYGTKYIIDFRDPWSLQKTIDGNFLKKFKNIIYKCYARYVERKTFKYASFITMVNETMTSDYQKTFPKYKDKIVTLPNAIDLDDYNSVKPYKFNGRTILYTGKFSTASGFRNPKNFLLALKKINENRKEKIRFVHVGSKEEKVFNIVRELDCKKIVDFYGNCSYKDTISYCKGADILLVLSTKEKSEQTGKIYDYLGCKKSILAITNSNNEIYKICKKYNIDTINNDNVNEIIEKIESLLKYDTKKYNIEDMQTRETVSKDLIKLFDNIKEGDNSD